MIKILAVRDRFSACEQRIEHGPRDVPTVAIIGASYTAGVGSGVASRSWAAVLARRMRWNAVIYGVPGAGYVSTGYADLGPVVRMLGEERLRGLSPALVIVQAGHDDVGVPPSVERTAVRRAIKEIRALAPRARIALLTVFTRPDASNLFASYQTDQAIVTTARAVDPKVIVMDPLADRWKFLHFGGSGLHPTAVGDAQIAQRVAAILRSHGMVAAHSTSATATSPVVCQVSVGVGSNVVLSRGAKRDTGTLAVPARPQPPLDVD